MSVIRSEKFIMVESDQNHNKCWYIEEHDTGMIRTTWGRVGNTLTCTDKQFDISTVSKEYDKLVRSKTKKGYTKLRTVDSSACSADAKSIQKKNLEDIALNEIVYDKADNQIKSMISIFCQENIHNITTNTSITFNKDTNVFQTPCGVVTLDAINDARNILNKIYDYVNKHDFTFMFKSYTEQYCSIIPQKIHGRLDCKKLFSSVKDVERQNDVLDSLKDSIETIEQLNKSADKTNEVKKIEKLFNCEIVKVTDVKVIKKITELYNNTRQTIHACRNLKVKTVYTINIENMTNVYEETKKQWTAKNKDFNEQQLWHGTKKQNIISIMKNGMIIPPKSASHCVGRLYGDYLYFSDQSTKSLNYAYGWWAGSRDNHCYMFLNKVLLGKSYIPKYSEHCTRIPSGYDSIFAKGGVSNVQNNEMMVMPNQVCPEYLVEFGE